MNKTEFNPDRLDEAVTQTIETLNDKTNRITKAVGRGVVEIAADDEVVTLATPDVAENQNLSIREENTTAMYISIVPGMSEEGGCIAVTDRYMMEDYAWEGRDEVLLEAVDELINEDHLVVVEDPSGEFE